MAKLLSKRIIQLSESVPVYDITTSKYQNFSVEKGCIVHNSKDCSDAVAGSVYSAFNDFVKFPIMQSMLGSDQRMNDNFGVISFGG